MHTATVLPHSFQLQNDSLGSGGGGVGAQITSSSQDMVERQAARRIWCVWRAGFAVLKQGKFKT